MKFDLYQAKADLYWNWKKNYYSGTEMSSGTLIHHTSLLVIIYTL